MRIAVPIPCKAPFDWVPVAVKKRSDALRRKLKAAEGSHEGTPAEVIRETLWDGLDWLDKELAAGRYPIRPSALHPNGSKATPRVAYSLLGKFVELPSRLDKVVGRLNKYEPERFAGELVKLVSLLANPVGVDDVFCASWEPQGSPGRLGAQFGFTVDPRKGKSVLEAIESLTRYESKWTNASLARALLARGLKEYAPAGFEQ